MTRHTISPQPYAVDRKDKTDDKQKAGWLAVKLRIQNAGKRQKKSVTSKPNGSSPQGKHV